MQDLFRRLVGGRQEPAQQPSGSGGNGAPADGARPTPGATPGAIPGAPFTRQELPALLGETGDLAEFVAGRSDQVSPKSGVLSLIEAGLWLTFVGDGARAAAAFRAAAVALRPQALLGAADALARARREPLPVEAGTKAGLCLALAGDEEGA